MGVHMADRPVSAPQPFRCPDPVKGQRCPVCGSSYICLRWREKLPPPLTPTPHKEHP